MNLYSELSFFITSVSSSPLVLALTSSHHAEYLSVPFCSTVFSHRLVRLFSAG